jgi:hypothetical protein
MTLTPFTLVEMRGMSLLTATWFMFIVAGGGALTYWILREFSNVWERIDKHGDDITEIREDMSTMRENVAVTRNVVERIERMVDNPK